MSQFLVWPAAALSAIYGGLTALAGFGQLKSHKIQTWAAWGMVFFGLLCVVAALLAVLHSSVTLWVLVIGLLGIHALTINNGIKMFGKINPVHHLVRLVVSIVLITLTYLALK